jgi:beta-glucosidase
MEKFQLGLFENPYVDEDEAEKIAGNAIFTAKANLAFRKSVVLLRNETKTLPVTPKTKIYVETYYQKTGSSPSHVYDTVDSRYNVTFVKTPGEADMILVWVTPAPAALFASQGNPIYLSLSKNNVDVAYINGLIAKKPTILAINYTNPWVIDEIYNPEKTGNIKAVIATFNTTLDALLDVVTGKFNPSGKMPFTTPVSEAAVEKQLSDVPGYLKGKSYALFKYNEGLSYH